MEPEIVFEDDQLLILNKPSGWVVNEASTTAKLPVIQVWLKDTQSYKIVDSLEFRSGIVHRLDKETSGVLVIAKTKKSFKNVQKQFKERKVKKVYLGLAHGVIEPAKGEIGVPVGRLPWNRRRFGVIAGGRAAHTGYKVKKIYSKGSSKFSLVEFYPKTGRTHQIRIHAKYLHHPLVSDTFYAGRKTARGDRKWCPRLFLHALSISFTHPAKGVRESFRSELSSDLSAALALLESD